MVLCRRVCKLKFANRPRPAYVPDLIVLKSNFVWYCNFSMSADGNDDKLELFKEVRFYCMGELNEKVSPVT